MAAVLRVWGLNALMLPLLREKYYTGVWVVSPSKTFILLTGIQSFHTPHPHDWLWMVSPSTAGIVLTGYGWSVPPQPASS